jgi:TetR/AcrR family transcriptional regulator, cholesterol catabolism regulator
MAKGKLAQSAAPPGTKNEKRWDEVVQAAADLFNEEGYQAATLQDIGNRLGILKGSLYYYIETKEDLLFEILRRAHLGGIETVREDPAAKDDPPPVRLEALIRRWMLRIGDNPVEFRVAENDRRHLTEPRQAEITKMRRKIAKSAYDIIVAGIATGDFDSSVEPWLAASTLFRILSTTMDWFRPGRQTGLDDVINWYVKLFVDGLSPGRVSGALGIAEARMGSH